MKASKIKLSYLACVEPRIKEAVLYANDTRFDMLDDICKTQYGYRLFYPVAEGWSSHGLEFDALVNLYHDIRYCWDDDGDMSVVHVTIKNRTVPVLRSRVYMRDDVFIMWGDRRELSWDTVKQHALKHAVEHSSLSLYEAIRFVPETLTWFHSLLPDVKRTEQLGHSTNFDSYFEKERQMTKRMVEFIRSDKTCFQGKP